MFYSWPENFAPVERLVTYSSGKIKDVDSSARICGKRPAFDITFQPSVNVTLFDLFKNNKIQIEI